MTKTAQAPASSTAPDHLNTKGGSRKVVLFFALAIGLTLLSMLTGYVLRDRFQAMGGPLKVEVRNETDRKIIADIFVEQVGAGIEMDAGQGGFIRFNPEQPGPVLVRLYGGNRGGPLLKTIEEGNFQPHKADHVRFTIISLEEVQVDYPK